jgi:hypothetical protein
MSILIKPLGHFTLGVWLALAALVLLGLAWGMQAYSLLDWDSAVDLGLQNERFTGDAAERAWARESWGVALADMLWPMPLTFVAFVGLLRKKTYGFAAGLMAMTIGFYFPLFFAFQRWAVFPETVVVAVALFALPSLLGIVGLYANRRLFSDGTS